MSLSTHKILTRKEEREREREREREKERKRKREKRMSIRIGSCCWQQHAFTKKSNCTLIDVTVEAIDTSGDAGAEDSSLSARHGRLGELSDEAVERAGEGGVGGRDQGDVRQQAVVLVLDEDQLHLFRLSQRRGLRKPVQPQRLTQKPVGHLPQEHDLRL